MIDSADRLFVILVSNRFFSRDFSRDLRLSHLTIYHFFRFSIALFALDALADIVYPLQIKKRNAVALLSLRYDPAKSKKYPRKIDGTWDSSFKLNRTKIELYFSIPIFVFFRELRLSFRSAQKLSRLTGPTTAISREPIPEEISRCYVWESNFVQNSDKRRRVENFKRHLRGSSCPVRRY